MSKPVKEKAPTFEEMIQDVLGGDITEELKKMIRSYAMGQEVWFTWYFDGLDVNPPGVTQYTIPLFRITLGMHGALLGKENYVWYFCGWQLFPTKAEIEQNISGAINKLREQKAAQLGQLNGQGGGLPLPQGPSEPLPKRLPPGLGGGQG